ncbi:hypothetical protein NQ314_015457 [Rhamnusium bicolor]|uniref:Bcl-2 Bcl-2 homology region 1-3 domain-containing protein n=1 Tax=Rhamnusium bicolor TaxID=1586634 RepID=A0AAV8WZL4_9CUCU|nr:hypothetical protein NQ314_015457 [Rhamnusium bicolor]
MDKNDDMNEKCDKSDISENIYINRNEDVPERLDLHDNSGDSCILASQDVVDETYKLYIYHLKRRMAEIGLKFPFDIKKLGASQYSSSLQTLANQFVVSPQRGWVHEQAQNVDLHILHFNTFRQLLFGLFQEGGLIWERVLVIFYFCSDLSIRALQEKVSECYLHIHKWTTFYLDTRLSVWVEQQGGWVRCL